jgi:GPH family glycoside/pentoside/hexuronide:cation symporter
MSQAADQNKMKAGPTVAKADQVPFFQKFIYGIAGPVDIWSVWIIGSIAYQIFNMEMGIAPTVVGLGLLAFRLWDSFTDPLMGWISDNTRTRWGRRRPWIFLGAILTGLTFPLMWWFPQDMSATGVSLWVLGFGVLFYTCFTIWNMPYQCMIMEITPDYNERTRVATVRGLFQTLAGVGVTWVWWMTQRSVFANPETGIPESSTGMRYVALGVGALIIILGVLPAIFVKERYYEHKLTAKQDQLPLVQSFRETFRNSQFLILCAVALLFAVSTMFYNSFGAYMGTYYVLAGNLEVGSTFQGYGGTIAQTTNFILIPFFWLLSERIGKPNVLMISLSLVLVGSLSVWLTYNPNYPYLMLVNGFFMGAANASLWLMVPSMQADVVDYDELKSGERREGTFASVFSWVMKLGMSIAFFLPGPVLDLIGFSAELGGEQAEGVFTALRLVYILLPGAAALLALYLIHHFTITPESALRIREQLELKRGKV